MAQNPLQTFLRILSALAGKFEMRCKRLFRAVPKRLRALLIIGALGVTVGCIVVISLAIDNRAVQKTETVQVPVPTTTIRDSTALDEQFSHAVTATAPSTDYGFSADELVWMDAARRDRQLNDIKAMGASWVRIDMQWYVVQPSNAHTYDWSVYDRVIDAINRHNLRVLVILDYAPAWASLAGCRPSPQHKCAPADPQTFARYAAAAAGRYTSRGVTAWEIWNEPNSPRFWYPGVDVEGYAAVLKAAYPAIKGVNINATVVTAGLKAATTSADISPSDYMAALYDAGAKPYFDAIGAHPYSFPTLPSVTADWSGWTQMLRIRNIAVAKGDAAKKIWITEVGASTGGPHPVSESRQAKVAEEAVLLRNSYTWAGPLFWYDYKDLGTNHVTGENFYGLVRHDGSHKPAYDSFLQAAKQR